MTDKLYEFIEVTYGDNGMKKSEPAVVSEAWMEEYLAARLTRTRTIHRSSWDGQVRLHRFFMTEALFTPINMVTKQADE